MNGAKFDHILGDILEKMNVARTAMVNHMICLRNIVEPAVEKIIMSPIEDRIVTAIIMPKSSLFSMLFCNSMV